MKHVILATGLLAFSMQLHAVAEPVIDLAAIAKLKSQLEQMKTQLGVMRDTYNNAKSQLNGINDLKKYNSGKYGFGDLENGLNDLQSWQSSADNWNDALKNISGGNNARYAELVKAYEAAHPTLSEADLSRGTTPLHATQYQQNKALNKAVSVETTYAFNEINQRLKSIHTLSGNIEKATNTKGAIDLNSRLIAELAYIEVLNLKLQTLISQQLVQNGASELAEENELIRFNTLPDK
jgi:type IV secretion system protein VirB5